MASDPEPDAQGKDEVQDDDDEVESVQARYSRVGSK
jgi:hypothetical protein